ncbi:MAG: SURF1 family protein [Siculibacillus sp.]|nr:SURF1 family protein [Siculibacillus sp.]
MNPAARGLILPGVAAAIVVAILASLGTWQLRRLAWKTDLIAALTERTKAAPIAAPSLEAARAADPEAIDWTPVRLTGRFLAERDLTVHAILGEPRGRFGGPGVWVMTPLVRDDGTIVWVNRGFVPRRGSDLAPRDPPPPGETTITGILRRAEPRGTHTPADDPAHRLWFVRDPAVLAAAAELEAGRVAPYTVDADASLTPAGGLPQAGETRLSYPNDHLGYAVTWYGLAVSCIAVFGVFARGRLRSGS